MGIAADMYHFLFDEKIPFSRKIKITILGILAAFLINNHYDLIHTIVFSYKVDYLVKLESAKQQYTQDAKFIDEVDRLIETEHNRKGAVEKFFSLLTPKADEIEKYNFEMAYNKILRERDPIVHTISGSFIPLAIFVFSLLGMVISVLFPELRNFDSFFWGIMLALIGAFFTYYVALFWVFLDPISGCVWINYIIQGVTNLMLIALFVTYYKGYGFIPPKKENDVEEFENPLETR